jgi:hypothetical protein
MRRKLVTFMIGVAVVIGTAAVVTARPASAGGCPRNSHLVQCPTYSFCCPNNAFCACLP